MPDPIRPPVSCLLNIASLRKFYESAWRDGFRHGADHGNLGYKYPPEDIAWLQHKNDLRDLFVCLTREESKAIREWDDADYTRRTDEVRWRIDDPEEIAAEQAIGAQAARPRAPHQRPIAPDA